MKNIPMGLMVSLILAGSVAGQELGKGPAFMVKMSEHAAKEIEASNGIVDSPLLHDRLQSVVRDVMEASDIRQVFSCRILKNEAVNAFALPAGPVYVTIGMLIFLDSLKTDEAKSVIAGIVGHEIAHVYLRHSVAWARLSNFIKEQPSQIPADIARILELGYVREQEFEADEYGVLYALRAGYDFESIVRFYKQVRQTFGETAPGDELYDDHPRMTERIARLYEVRAQVERDFDQFSVGAAALNQGRYDEAISAFRAYTSTFSNSAQGWTDLGTAYLFKALSLIEGPPVLYMVTYHDRTEDALRGKPEELTLAEESFKRAVELDTSYNLVYNGNMGIVAALNAEYDKAEEFTRRALAAGTEEHFFLNNLGNIYYLRNRYEDGADAYRQAIAKDDNWPLPKYNLAQIYEKAGQRELAVDAWKKLLDVSGFGAEAARHLSALDPKYHAPAPAIAPETTLAGLVIGTAEEQVIELLGEPDGKIAVEKIIALEYARPGIMVFLRNGKVSGVLAGEGFAGETSKGIKIGSRTAEVRSAYGLPEDIVIQKSGDQWVYGGYGMMIGVRDGLVNALQLVEVVN